MIIEEYRLLSIEDKIAYACLFEPVAWREMKPRWFFIVYKVGDYFVELTFDEYSNNRLAINARTILANSFSRYIKNKYYAICCEFRPLSNLSEEAIISSKKF